MHCWYLSMLDDYGGDRGGDRFSRGRGRDRDAGRDGGRGGGPAFGRDRDGGGGYGGGRDDGGRGSYDRDSRGSYGRDSGPPGGSFGRGRDDRGSYGRGGGFGDRGGRDSFGGGRDVGGRGGGGGGDDEMQSQPDTIFVQGLSDQITEQELVQHFGSIGIIKVKLASWLPGKLSRVCLLYNIVGSDRTDYEQLRSLVKDGVPESFLIVLKVKLFCPGIAVFTNMLYNP